MRTAGARLKIQIITASAGSGKTYRLTGELAAAIADGSARPDSIVATTFTTQAAAELIERARSRLLQTGQGQAAHQLLAARIGTVNAVCGALVADFAFELGMSPAVHVLDEAAAELEFRRALGRVVSAEVADELETYKDKFQHDYDWRDDVLRIVEAARANAIDADGLAACAERSLTELDACLGPLDAGDLDGQLTTTLATAIAALEGCGDVTKGTLEHIEFLKTCAGDHAAGRLRWGSWASLVSKKPNKQGRPHAEPVHALGDRHIGHPRLRADMHALVRQLFGVARVSLTAYQTYKRERGVVDFTDQETLALELLRRPDVREALAGQIDLFLVDEFQDTSPLQLALFLEIAQLAKRSIWVGDPKQAIYAFRGTDPALMDAAIESLTSPTTDADLITRATDAIGGGAVETLSTSYRSRPDLVHITSEIFARAFAAQDMAPARVRLTPALATEPPGLGEVLEFWPLEFARAEGTDNAIGRALALAAGVRELLDRQVKVRRGAGVEAAARRDLAVLCRTNAQCQAVATALAALDIAAVVPRMRILETLEGRVAVAGLALWIDPGDALAAAELARVITHPEDLDAIVARAVAAPGQAAFRDDPEVAAVTAARTAGRDLGPVAALEAVFAATDLRGLCAGWGDSAQRLANLDALRAHAVGYVGLAVGSSDAATVVGLVRHLRGLVASSAWGETRHDHQALRGGDNAVTVSTWHRAKGLEWPITVLYGLETMREPRSDGVHVMSTRADFDVAEPLAGRWVRYWPHVYNATNQNGSVRTAYEASPAHGQLEARAAREALRVLYVGWTRARDRLVLAVKRGELMKGIVKTLVDAAPGVIAEPAARAAGVEAVRWADVDVAVWAAPCTAGAAVEADVVPGTITVGRARSVMVAARTSPSAAEAVPCTLGEVVELGPRFALQGKPEMEDVGHAVHGFLAADRPGLTEMERLALADELLTAYGVSANVRSADVLAAASRLWAWIQARFPTGRLHREWPVMQRTDAGTVVAGTADLVIAHGGGFVVVDHKTFPGGVDAAAARAAGYAGQLLAYANAISAATSASAVSTWVHFPVLGQIIELRVDRGAAH